MRRLVLILLLALAVPAAALAGPNDRGDGTFVLKDARGMAVLSGSGFVLGRVDDGAVTITDGTPNDGSSPAVFGADGPPVQKGATRTYSGKDIRFRFIGAQRYRVTIIGAGIDISAVGSGRVSLLGGDQADSGRFSLDGAGFLAVPTTLFAGTFGQQAASATGG